mmetsp:Transcript_28344/g.39030  ORF Transcript_28344/g.39030 Transcript_28344/m.39030 type:complete len:459 (+) Transcript_28344:10-1386(+)
MTEFSSVEQLSGLAGEIRSSISSEQYDLGGYTEQRSKDLIHAAFSSPLPAPTEMIKCTFIVGGGKLVRSRYAEDMSKWLIAALREIGYTEDRSAAETFDSQGTFKQQHDTGQNLKYLIVYPHVACSKSGAQKADSSTTADTAVNTSSPEYIVTACELATFKEIVLSQKLVSYKQRKRLLKHLQDSSDKFKKIEEKLVTGALLDPAEQAYYDANSGADTEKIAWLQAEIKDMVDKGQLTKEEKAELLTSLDANLAAVSAEIAEAEAEKKPKKVEKLQQKKQSILARKEVVSKVTEPIRHRLKHGDEIQRLRVKLLSMQALEDKGRSMSLTLADLKVLEEKSDVEKAVSELEAASRGWLELEEDFVEMCKYEEKEAKLKYNQRVKAKQQQPAGAKKAATGTTGKTSSGVIKYATGASNSNAWMQSIGKGSGGGGGGGYTTSTAKKATSSGFASAFDSDSD